MGGSRKEKGFWKGQADHEGVGRRQKGRIVKMCCILELLGLCKIPKLSHSQIYPCKSVELLTCECFAFVSGPEGHISECLLSEH